MQSESGLVAGFREQVNIISDFAKVGIPSLAGNYSKENPGPLSQTINRKESGNNEREIHKFIFVDICSTVGLLNKPICVLISDKFLTVQVVTHILQILCQICELLKWQLRLIMN
jgi:hypothetical protein